MKMRSMLTWILCSSVLAVCAQEVPAERDEAEEEKPVVSTKKKQQKARIKAPEYKNSTEKLEKIHKFIWEKLYEKDNGKWINLEDATIRDGVLDDVKNNFGKGVLKPSKPAEPCDIQQIKIKVHEQMVREGLYRDSEKLKKDYRNTLNAKYPLAKKGDKVKIYYRRGDTSYACSGIFYGFGGGSVRINSKNIATVNLTPESRILLDEKYRADWMYKEVERYVNLSNADLDNELNTRSRKELLKQIHNNESLGYIFDVSGNIANEKNKHLKKEKEKNQKSANWLTLQDVFDVEWNAVVKEYHARDVEEKRILEEKKKQQAAEGARSENGEAPAEDNGSSIADGAPAQD